MSDMAYPACIRELYESEIFGEAVFLALVDIAKSPREKYQLGTLLQLETETKDATSSVPLPARNII